MKAKKSVLIQFTKDWNGLKEGDTLACSRDIAAIHIGTLKHAKVYVKPVKQKSKKK